RRLHRVQDVREGALTGLAAEERGVTLERERLEQSWGVQGRGLVLVEADQQHEEQWRGEEQSDQPGQGGQPGCTPTALAGVVVLCGDMWGGRPGGGGGHRAFSCRKRLDTVR